MANYEIEKYQNHKKKGTTLIRYYVPGEDLTGVSISDADKKQGCPKKGDMIARGKNPEDKWLINEVYYNDNYELDVTFDELRDQAFGK